MQPPPRPAYPAKVPRRGGRAAHLLHPGADVEPAVALPLEGLAGDELEAGYPAAQHHVAALLVDDPRPQLLELQVLGGQLLRHLLLLLLGLLSLLGGLVDLALHGLLLRLHGGDLGAQLAALLPRLVPFGLAREHAVVHALELVLEGGILLERLVLGDDGVLDLVLQLLVAGRARGDAAGVVGGGVVVVVLLEEGVEGVDALLGLVQLGIEAAAVLALLRERRLRVLEVGGQAVRLRALLGEGSLEPLTPSLELGEFLLLLADVGFEDGSA